MRRRSLWRSLDGYRDHLRASGVPARQVDEAIFRVSALTGYCSIRRLWDLRSRATAAALADFRRREGRDFGTAYLRTFHHFLLWMDGTPAMHSGALTKATRPTNKKE
jgi:hypothetical protein